ncbi:hypothetical protein A4A49_31742 [Nicotiana attenuata]|uniref:Uncharacterized protein n=1 Tax=Nicotiana attenuata TaxID=49451 RepID=A0A314KW88_NICAT|nr:hypothetical protein A4A49_31742 [Nicotiana attenuata]
MISLVLYECACDCDCFKLFFVFKGVTFPMHLVYHYATIKTSDVRNLSGIKDVAIFIPVEPCWDKSC